MIALLVFEYLWCTALPAAAMVVVFVMLGTAIFRPKDMRAFRWALALGGMALVFTLACWVISIFDFAMEWRGGHGLVQEVTLLALLLEACVPLGFLGRGIARSF